MSLNANALVTLAQAKSHLNIPVLDTTQDTRVTQFINAASDYVENTTNRKMVSATYTHRFGGSGTPFLLLREYPVTAITSVYEDETWVFAGPSLILSTDYVIHREIQIARKAPTLWQSTKSLAVQVIYVAGYTTIPFDLQQVALSLVEILFDMRDQRTTRTQSRAKLGDSISLFEKMPEHITAMLAPHIREAYVKSQLAMA